MISRSAIEGSELTEVAFVGQPVGQVPDCEEQTAGGEERGRSRPWSELL